jgi:GntR family histidine utilization transcriptional repressor
LYIQVDAFSELSKSTKEIVMALPERQESAPLYQQVKGYVVDHIVSGKWPEAYRVPSENELTQILHVSRMTVHRALRELHSEGWLTRVQGAGSFVAEQKPQSALLEIRNIREEVTERGHRYGCRVLALERRRASADVARALELEAGAEVFFSLLLHQEEGTPVQVEERVVNPAFAPDYIHQDFTRITPYEYLIDLGPMDAAEHVVEAVLPDARSRRLLGICADEPCLLLTRRTWSHGLVVSRARLTYAGSRYRLAGRQDYTPRLGPVRE